MTMTKLKRYMLAALLCVAATAFAQDEEASVVQVPEKEKTALVEGIVSEYFDWENISMSGKLSSPMLPVTASVKVYMEKDSLLMVSISAPLIGEAFRMEVDRDCALFVNKLSNNFSRVDMTVVEPVVPGGITALQNMLLSRITILGAGTLSLENSGLVDIYSNNPGVWTVMPLQDVEQADAIYFYTVDNITLLLENFVVMAQNGEAAFYTTYTPSNKDTSIDFELNFGEHTMQATLKLNQPDMNPKKMDRINLTGKFSEVPLSRIMR